MRNERYLSELDNCFSWPHNHEDLPLELQRYQFIDTDHMIPNQAYKIHRDVLTNIFRRPYNKAKVCRLHHYALEECKTELFRQSGLLGVIYFIATDYPRPHPSDEEMQDIFRNQVTTLFENVLIQIKRASLRGPSGKISKERMKRFPQIRKVLEVSIDFLNEGNLVVPKPELDLLIAS